MSRRIQYEEEELRLADALQYKADHPAASFRFLQDQFKVNKDKLQRRLQNKQRSRINMPTPKNARLQPEQGKDMCHSFAYLAKFGIPLGYRTLRATAMQIHADIADG